MEPGKVKNAAFSFLFSTRERSCFFFCLLVYGWEFVDEDSVATRGFSAPAELEIFQKMGQILALLSLR